METCLQPREVVLDFGLLPLQVLCPQLETVAAVQVAHRSLAAVATTGDNGNSEFSLGAVLAAVGTGAACIGLDPILLPLWYLEHRQRTAPQLGFRSGQHTCSVASQQLCHHPFPTTCHDHLSSPLSADTNPVVSMCTHTPRRPVQST